VFKVFSEHLKLKKIDKFFWEKIFVFLGNVFTNFIFEKFLSHEALVTGRVTATSNNQMHRFK